MPRNSTPNDPAVRLAWSADRSDLVSPFIQGGEPVSADELFEALDGRPFRFFDNSWRLKIYSIYDHDGYRWLQVRLEGRPQHSTTLRVGIEASTEDVISALTNWLIEERPRPVAGPLVH